MKKIKKILIVTCYATLIVGASGCGRGHGGEHIRWSRWFHWHRDGRHREIKEIYDKVKIRWEVA